MDTKLNTLSRQLTQMTQTPRGQELLGHINIIMEPGKRVANQNDGYVFFFSEGDRHVHNRYITASYVVKSPLKLSFLRPKFMALYYSM